MSLSEKVSRAIEENGFSLYGEIEQVSPVCWWWRGVQVWKSDEGWHASFQLDFETPAFDEPFDACDKLAWDTGVKSEYYD